MRSLHVSDNSTVVCPVCGKGSSCFVPYKDTGDTKCVSCGSSVRHRGQIIWLMEETDFFRTPLKVLHFAPEQCLYDIFHKQNNLQYFTGDIIKSKAQLIVDITDIMFKDCFFDVVV